MNLKFIIVLIFLPIIIFFQTTKEKIDSLLTVVYPQVKFKVSTLEYIKKNVNTISEAKKINFILGHINIANVLWLNAKYKESITYLCKSSVEIGLLLQENNGVFSKELIVKFDYYGISPKANTRYLPQRHSQEN